MIWSHSHHQGSQEWSWIHDLYDNDDNLFAICVHTCFVNFAVCWIFRTINKLDHFWSAYSHWFCHVFDFLLSLSHSCNFSAVSRVLNSNFQSHGSLHFIPSIWLELLDSNKWSQFLDLKKKKEYIFHWNLFFSA